jgi:hypothetical protein
MCPVADHLDQKAAVEAYMLNYFKALRTLEQASDRLEDAADDAGLPESERAAAVAAYLDMGREIAHLEAAHDRILEAFTGGAAPPSADLVAQSLQLSARLADELAQRNDAVAIIQVATSFVNGWAGLLGGAAAPAPAAGMRAAAVPPRRDPAADLQVERTVRATNMEFLGLGRHER